MGHSHLMARMEEGKAPQLPVLAYVTGDSDSYILP